MTTQGALAIECCCCYWLLLLLLLPLLSQRSESSFHQHRYMFVLASFCLVVHSAVCHSLAGAANYPPQLGWSSKAERTAWSLSRQRPVEKLERANDLSARLICLHIHSTREGMLRSTSPIPVTI